ncbi:MULTISPECIES: (2Fe-2S)-binding protein [Pacificibacter]|uniref:(2Fe-2S)-binding protein n=1 Tax=Pacificibacter TaxID=1042323 RepID=UPI001C092548|nr:MULTISPECIES: (2Fe-2S)-binding protein [Pacificibacter]MBU2935561.1 (2Fe-2S)-binding protein [Pacificibacter marinus]MDO6614057.1 (2Fe-2S)-binding protein [Pacificibacter sp. 1_MG-2023]
MIQFKLNGVPAQIAADAMLLTYLREDIGATATKIGCDIGRCGACTVLRDGAPINACLVMGWQIEHAEITTITGLETQPAGRVLIKAMEIENGFQCGYCAPGVMMSLTGLLSVESLPDDAMIEEALEGNICRCTGYHSILRGARLARDMMKDTRR